MRISAIIIAKNEQRKIRDCIKSLHFADEIILINNNSTDNTEKIARDMGCKVFNYQKNDFAKLRNFGKIKSNGDWLLYVDADERVSMQLANEIRKSLKNKEYNAYALIRQNYYYGKKWPYQEKIVRLVKKTARSNWFGKIHETVRVDGEIGALQGYLLHYTHDDIAKMVEKTNEWSEIEARLRLSAGHPQMVWWRFFRVIAGSFWDSYIRKSGWRAGIFGIVESIYQSYSTFITYSKLWELQNEKIKP